MSAPQPVDGARFFDAEVLRWGEKAFQAKVLSTYVGSAKKWVPNAWKAYHTFFSDRSEAGWPDLVLVRDRIVYAELKGMKGVLGDRQKEWYDALIAAGGEAYIWRPCCWISGEIEAVLR